MEICSHAHWYIVTSNFFPSAGIKAQLIWLYLVHYCTDCHTDPLCDLQRGWRRGKRHVLHTHARAICIITFSLVLIFVHRLTNYTNMSKLRLIVASGDACSLKLQHKALLCCSHDICTILTTVLGPLMQYHVGISLDLRIIRAHISICTFIESVLDCYCVFKYSYAQDSQCFCRLRCQTLSFFIYCLEWFYLYYFTVNAHICILLQNL